MEGVHVATHRRRDTEVGSPSRRVNGTESRVSLVRLPMGGGRTAASEASALLISPLLASRTVVTTLVDSDPISGGGWTRCRQVFCLNLKTCSAALVVTAGALVLAVNTLGRTPVVVGPVSVRTGAR